MNDNEKLEHFIRCLRAEAGGKEVQLKCCDGKWGSVGIGHVPFQSFNASNWRVKPDAPKVAPHTWETAPLHVRARRKEGPEVGVITALPNYAVFMWSVQGKECHSYTVACALFELLDGSPYGIEQKEESEVKWYVDCEKDLWRVQGDSVMRFRRQDQYTVDPEKWRWQGMRNYEPLTEVPAAAAERIIAAAQKEAK